MRPLILTTALIFALAGCTPEPDLNMPQPAPSVQNACGADALQNLVGQDASVLETMRFGQITRILRPDMMVTMDFSAARLNIQINDAEKITSVTCG